MKVLIFCLVLGTVLKFNTAEELPTGCPANEDPRYPTHLPHATDCGKFWKCDNGVPHLNYCEGGLQWSIENSWCDYPEYAKCVRPIPEDGGENGGGEDSSEEGAETDLPTGCDPNEDPRYPTHLPHATDCDKFWKCLYGVPQLNQCPQGQHWSIENTWCDYIVAAKCVRPIPEDGGENGGGEDSSEEGGETDLPSGCDPNEDPRYPTHLPHATDCDKFWKCLYGIPQLNQCPQGQHWSIENTWCDYIVAAKCVRPITEEGGENSGGDDSIEDGTQLGGETDLPTGCDPNEDPRYPTHLPHATDCDKFWKCLYGIPQLNQCPQGQHWSIENTWCDYIVNAKCVRPIPEDGGENGGGEDSSEEEGETDLPTGCDPNEDPRYPTHLPHATDCDKFWKCLYGVPQLNQCPQGQHWSIENTWCDYIVNAKCVRPIPEGGGENGGGEESSEEEGETDLPTGCDPNEDPRYPTHFPHATDCDKFWKCDGGVPYLHYCEGGLQWSIENSWCDYPEYAKCVRPIPEGGGENGGGEDSGENGGEIEQPTVCENTNASHLPHATDCTKFWQCVGGIAYLNECQPGLHWNIERQYCDYPANANCQRSLQN